jgi:hypothetical protein
MKQAPPKQNAQSEVLKSRQAGKHGALTGAVRFTKVGAGNTAIRPLFGHQ